MGGDNLHHSGQLPHIQFWDHGVLEDEKDNVPNSHLPVLDLRRPGDQEVKPDEVDFVPGGENLVPFQLGLQAVLQNHWPIKVLVRLSSDLESVRRDDLPAKVRDGSN